MNLNKKRFVTLVSYIGILIGVISLSISWTVLATGPVTGSWGQSGIIIPYSYVIWKEGSTYYAKDSYGAMLSGYDAGSSNASQIENAAISASPIGGSIVTLNGLYSISAPITITKSLTFSGVGNGTIFQNTAGIDFVGTAIIVTQANDITLTDFQIDGQKTTITTDAQYKNQGIHIGYIPGTPNLSTKNILIERVYIHDVYMSGIEGGYIDNLKILHSTILNTGKTGAAYGGHGIYLSYASDILIEGNTIKATTGQGIKLVGVDGYASLGIMSSHQIVKNNFMFSNVLSYGVVDLSISDNDFINCSYGVQFSYSTSADRSRDIQIRDNSYYGNGNANQYFTFIGVYNLTVNGNQFYSTGGGIVCDTGSQQTISNNKFHNAIINDDVIFTNVNNSTVEGNTIFEWKTNGIHLYGIKDSSANNNHLYKKDTSGNNAIYLDSCTDCTALGDYVEKGNYAVRETGDHNAIIGLTAYDTLNGVSITGTASVFHASWVNHSWTA